MSGLILSIIASLGLAVEPAATPDPMDTFFKTFAEKRAPIHHVAATFEERTFIGEDFFESEGTFLYVKPRRMIRRTVKPEPTTILLNDRTLFQHEPEVLQLIVEDLDNTPEADLLFLGFDASLETLRERYDISLFTIKDDPDAGQGVLIKPFAEDLDEAPFIEVSLYLRNEDFLPYKIMIVTDEDGHTAYTLDNYTINGTLDPAETQLLLPEGTDIINGDVYIETVDAAGKRLPAAITPPATEDTPEEESP